MRMNRLNYSTTRMNVMSFNAKEMQRAFQHKNDSQRKSHLHEHELYLEIYVGIFFVHIWLIFIHRVSK